MPAKRAAFKARFAELERAPVPEWGEVRADDGSDELVCWRDEGRGRALALTEADPEAGALRFDHFFKVWGKDLLEPDEEVDMLCVSIADAAGHAAEIHEIYRLWLLEGAAREAVEERLEALRRSM